MNETEKRELLKRNKAKRGVIAKYSTVKPIYGSEDTLLYVYR